MKKQTTFASGIASILIAYTSLVGPAATAGPTNVPLKGNIAISESLTIANTPNAPSCPTPLAGMSVGIGNISYFGKIAYVGTDCVLPNGNNFDFSKGAFTITAANGDQIYGTYSGTFKPTGISPLSKMPIYTISGGTFTITHGTGKFVHAQGQGQLNGTEELSATPFDPDTPSHGQFQLTGSIRY